MSAPALYLVDSSIYIFRSWFGLPAGVWLGRDGRDWGAFYGFARFLLDCIAGAGQARVVACFDQSLGSGFRHRLHAGYKCRRSHPEEDLARQLAACERLAAALGLGSYASSEYEADDLIASLAARARERGLAVCVVSRDKDLGQVLGPGDWLWDGAARRLDMAGFTRHYGVSPSQVADYLALVGDPIDDIPGVPGIGRKSARVLLERAGDLDSLYRQLEAVPQWPLRGAERIAQRLAEYREQVLLARQLTALVRDLPLELPPPVPPERDTLALLLNELELGPRIQRALLGHSLWREAL